MAPPAPCQLHIGRSRSRPAQAADTDRCESVFDALAALKQHRYTAIDVVYADLPEPKIDALRALARFADADRITLLIDMHDEPAVLALRRQPGPRLFGDYQLHLDPPPAASPATPPAIVHPGRILTETAKDQYIRELEVLVTQDDLTGLKNRRYLRQGLPAILHDAAARNVQVTLLLFDLDNFKHYNDTYGHSVGDQVLVQTARLLRRCCRDHDVVARLGGDEFAVIFWDPGDGQTPDETAEQRRQCGHHPRQAQFMAQRFRKEISEAAFECLGPHGQGSLTISGGLASFPADGTTAEDLFEKADQAMLEAKRSGKNQIDIVGRPMA